MVTGGGGFIGGHVMDALAGCGAEPIAVVQAGVNGRIPPVGSSVSADLEDPDAVSRVLDGAELVVHLAARAGGIAFQRSADPAVFTVNRRITDNVLGAASAAGVKRVFLASSLVTYRASDETLTEDHPKLSVEDRPSPYAWSKITDEVVAEWHPDVETVVGRFGNIYGPGANFAGADATAVHALISRAVNLRNGEELEVWGDGKAVRSFVFVRDAADAVLTILASAPSGSTYNVDSGVPVTIAELATVVRDAVNPTLRLRFDASRPSGRPYRVPSVAALASLGFTAPTTLHNGVRVTVEWFKAHISPPEGGSTP